jgi:hypothetical protein
MSDWSEWHFSNSLHSGNDILQIIYDLHEKNSMCNFDFNVIFYSEITKKQYKKWCGIFGVKED